MIDPMQAFEGLVMATSTSTLPIPTVVPPKPHIQTATAAGERTLWVVTVIMALSSIAFYVMAYRVPANKRIFHVLTAFITTIAFISYYAMATRDGITVVHVSHLLQKTKKGFPNVYRDVFRHVYFARYIELALTTPLILIDLSLLAGLNGATTFVAVGADLIMVLTGLFAALTGHREGGSYSQGKRWGYFAWACLAYLTVVYQLLWNGRAAANGKGSKVGKFFMAIAGYTAIVWLLYPIFWGVAEGSRKISVDSEIIAYAIIDILAKPVFGFWLLLTQKSVPETSVSVDGYWAQGVAREGTLRVGDEDGA